MLAQLNFCHMQLIASVLILLHQPRVVYNYPSFANGEIVTVVEKIHSNNMSDLCNTNTNTSSNNSEALATDNEYNEWVTSADDLIIPVKTSDLPKNSTLAYHRIDLLTSAEELAGTYESTATPIQPIDMSDFLALIPPARMQAIVNNYYRHDPDVQQAYMFLESAEYAQLKHQLINAPEMMEFLQFLNDNGLDLLNFLHRLANLMSVNGITSIAMQTAPAKVTAKSTLTSTGIDTDDWTNGVLISESRKYIQINCMPPTQLIDF